MSYLRYFTNVFVSKSKKTIKCTAVLTLFFLLVTSRSSSAQMFSVDDTPGQSEVPTIAIFAGIEPVNFNYQGNSSAVGAGLYSFTGTVLRFKLETPGVNFYLATGGNATGLNDFSYFDAGVKLGAGVSLFQDENISLQIPLLVHTSITSVNNNEVTLNAAPEFAQGTFEGAGGLDFNAQLAPDFRFGANVVPSFGFSFSTRERDAGGSVIAVEGQARFYFDYLFGNAGLSLGYDYNYRDFRVNSEALNYDLMAHSILIGLTF